MYDYTEGREFNEEDFNGFEKTEINFKIKKAIESIAEWSVIEQISPLNNELHKFANQLVERNTKAAN